MVTVTKRIPPEEAPPAVPAVPAAGSRGNACKVTLRRLDSNWRCAAADLNAASEAILAGIVRISISRKGDRGI